MSGTLQSCTFAVATIVVAACGDGDLRGSMGAAGAGGDATAGRSGSCVGCGMAGHQAGDGAGASGSAGKGDAGAAPAGNGGGGSAGAPGASGGAAGDAGAGGGGAGKAGGAGEPGGGGSGGSGGGLSNGCATAPDETGCTTPNGDSGLCRAGSCSACLDTVDDLACRAAFGAGHLCHQGVCGTCDAGPSYVVDPNQGEYVGPSGAGTLGGVETPRCAYKTVTDAMNWAYASGESYWLHPSPPHVPRTIEVIGPSTLGASEHYPIDVSMTTMLTTRGGDVTIPASAAGGKTYVVYVNGHFDGGEHRFHVVGAGIQAVAAEIRMVTVTDAPFNGITVQNGGTVIRSGVTVSGSKYTGIGTIDGPLTVLGDESGMPIVIGDNGDGIATRFLTLHGARKPGSYTEGSVVVANNKKSGVAMAGGEVDGLVAFGNDTGLSIGSGMFETPASYVRNSVFTGNVVGIRFLLDSLPPSSPATNGHLQLSNSVLQPPAGAAPRNTGVGLCINGVDSWAGGTANGGGAYFKFDATGLAFGESCTTGLVEGPACSGGVDWAAPRKVAFKSGAGIYLQCTVD